MKKSLYILGIIFSIMIFLVSIYIVFNIYFIFSNVNGQLYDGFGMPYRNNEPSSPYTILGVGGFICSVTLLGTCSKNLEKMKGDNIENG